MTDEIQHSRLPEGATHHSVDERGVQSWAQPYGESMAAVAQVRIKDEHGEYCWLKQGVAENPERFDLMTEDQREIRRHSLIAEAKAVIHAALDFIAAQGPQTYRQMVEQQEREQNSGSES